MRILQVTEAAASGTFEVVRTIASGVAEMGHEVLVAFGRRPETVAQPAAILPDGVEHVALPWFERTARAQLRTARALREIARRWDPDVVHLHSAFAGVVGAVVLAGRWPTIYTPHGSPSARTVDSLLRSCAYRAAESLVARRSAVVGAVSQAEADFVRRNLRARHVAVVVNGVADLDTPPPPMPRAAGRPLVVGMGRIGAARRPSESAHILSSVADLAEVRWVGGSVSDEDAVFTRAGVHVTGWLDRAAALEHLAAATIYVNWSAWDGLSLTVLEAMARDVVVIASDIPANREVLGLEQVRSTPPEAIALLRAVLREPTLHARLLGEQKRRRSAFGAARMVVEWCALYERVAASRCSL